MAKPYQHLTLSNRILIEHERCKGSTYQDLAEILKIHRTTISREVRRNSDLNSRYDHQEDVITRTNHFMVPATGSRPTTTHSDAAVRIEAGKHVDGFSIATSGTPPHPSDRDILASIPGVGTIVLANLLGEAGTSGTAICRLAVFNWSCPRPNVPGNLIASIMARGQSGLASRHKSIPPVGYEALRTRGHTHGRALRSVADRLLAVACAMLKTGTLYQRSVTET